ncbi:hypothetical protein ACHWQZ_G008438 [Mnemiopsis leidyi]
MMQPCLSPFSENTALRDPLYTNTGIVSRSHHPGNLGHHHGNLGNQPRNHGNHSVNLGNHSGNLDNNTMVMRHPLSAPAALNNPMCDVTTPGFNSPTPTSSGLQHFSFSPSNVENLPPSLNYQPGSYPPPLPGSWTPGNQQLPDKRLVVNARQRSRVQNMNEAFKMLKEKVPGLNDEDKNFSKLEVLQCTISYLQHLYKVLGIDCSNYSRRPHVKERVQQLEKRFVVHGGDVKKRGSKRSRTERDDEFIEPY